MTEKLLQYIWQFQYFNKSELRTAAGEKLHILHPGILNTNQGPDFSNAQIKVDDTQLAGSIELHLKASHWKDHGHDHDPNYKNVILHVVFENDLAQSSIPVLELEPRVAKLLLDKYSGLMDSSTFIPCANSISQTRDIVWQAWKERLLAERLTRKSALVFQFLEETKTHWEESFWWLLARNFGMKVNSEAFEAIARSIPVNLLAKHKNQIQHLEALLLGQAGLLNKDFNDSYPKLLQREYEFMRKKYQLQAVVIPVHFLRMRPGNFPTIRLAQLAALIHNSAHVFSKILEIENIAEAGKLFRIKANDYWHYHYRFDETSVFKEKVPGKEMIDNVLINTVIPMLFAYGLYHKDEKYKSKAISWLEEIAAESNSITKGFSQLQLGNKTAFDSQAFIELKTQYCNHKLCLQCAVGNSLLKSI